MVPPPSPLPPSSCCAQITGHIFLHAVLPPDIGHIRAHQASTQSDLRRNTMAEPARRWSCLRGCAPVSPPPTACAVPPERCALLPAPAAPASTRPVAGMASAASSRRSRRRPAGSWIQLARGPTPATAGGRLARSLVPPPAALPGQRLLTAREEKTADAELLGRGDKAGVIAKLRERCLPAVPCSTDPPARPIMR